MTNWTDLFGDLTVAQALLWIIGALALIALVVKMWKPIKALADFMDDVKGEPARPGVPARPGLMERVGAIESSQRVIEVSLGEVRHEVMPNTGTSLNDAVRRTEATVSVLAESVDVLQKDMTSAHEKLDADHRRIEQIEKKEGQP